jgi:hypothetical protein
MQTLQTKPASPRRPGRLARVALLAAIGILGAGGAGCYPKGAQAPGALSARGVAWAATRWPGATEGSLSTGRDHFLSKCNGCHAYPDLAAVPEGRWPEILEDMAKKSHLGPEERDAVLHFVLAARSEQVGAR